MSPLNTDPLQALDELLTQEGLADDAGLRNLLTPLAAMASVPAPSPGLELAALMARPHTAASWQRWLQKHRPAAIGIAVLAGMGLGVTGVAASNPDAAHHLYRSIVGEPGGSWVWWWETPGSLAEGQGQSVGEPASSDASPSDAAEPDAFRAEQREAAPSVAVPPAADAASKRSKAAPAHAASAAARPGPSTLQNGHSGKQGPAASTPGHALGQPAPGAQLKAKQELILAFPSLTPDFKLQTQLTAPQQPDADAAGLGEVLDRTLEKLVSKGNSVAKGEITAGIVDLDLGLDPTLLSGTDSTESTTQRQGQPGTDIRIKAGTQDATPGSEDAGSGAGALQGAQKGVATDSLGQDTAGKDAGSSAPVHPAQSGEAGPKDVREPGTHGGSVVEPGGVRAHQSGEGPAPAPAPKSPADRPADANGTGLLTGPVDVLKGLLGSKG
ncbi:hypothetical protein V1639_17035 [Pseudarthrobacter sp. J75]|uniref:hypothetical protein n=1 Tax=unclassified Pseudarthrobacter TaxID=2647000 RepID=UPI002E805906|nr:MULTISPECIES: hypothetical protein [unclassified Pseudarthrobacter]MEE2522606.1 hypothetical protein [Pseudarthrobacter sp. J47]MEE2530721.1 hypothetical protein [Pseudarthrobacter sp. J75]MEE2571025.1 hypothetical protein [Pseudarthrobacter sp. J64]